MKKFLALLSSTKLMAVLLFIFAASIAIATFIEKDYGTDAARKLVYNARWFEVLMALGIINIVSVAIRNRMYHKEKLTLFIFHFAFTLIILGAGITRYFGREGFMHIRESETTRLWYSSETHIGLMVKDQNDRISNSYPVLFSSVTKNRFNRTLRLNSQKVKVETTGFIPKAEMIIVPDRKGVPLIQLITNTGDGRKEVILSQGQSLKTNRFILTFASVKSLEPDSAEVFMFTKDGVLNLIASSPVISLSRPGNMNDTLKSNLVHPVTSGAIYYIEGIPIVIKQYEASGMIDAQPAPASDEKAASAVKLTVKCGGISKPITIFGSKDEVGKFTFVTINGINIGVNYGTIEKQLPFELTLNDFVLKRYPGSESPSWYESQLLLTDMEKGKKLEFPVYMNHVLKHRGYRFYQSSYDLDEKGSILAVNMDGAGTTVTYLGYLLMAIGMVLSLFNKNSRFIFLSKSSVKAGKTKTTGILLLLMLLRTTHAIANDAQVSKLSAIDIEHAQQFGQVMIQDHGGRIEPVNTLASEVLRKIARKEIYHGQSPDQVLLGMMVYPEIWQHEPMIRVNHPELQKLLGIDTKYASFSDFFSKDQYRRYVLQSLVEEAYRKQLAHRTKFDNEVIRTDERLNVCYLVYTGTILNIFPAPADSAQTWYSPVNSEDHFTAEDAIFTGQIIQYYTREIRNSMETGNWKAPEEILQALKLFQQHYGKDLMPSTMRTRAETFYNRIDLFVNMARIYLLVGLLLLILQFIQVFLPRFKIKWIFLTAFIFIVIAFTVHTFGLSLRWYVSGHAPWSNGYEALIFIAWATVLAGIIFSRKAAIALSSTAVLAALILQTAHLSWMDPQVTNLVPVLKSYWLVVHVAVITSSYGFLGLAAFVAAINLLFMAVQTGKNYLRIEEQILQLLKVIEMSLIAGLYLLTIGTFLGGVWANESWGRYWGWDPKETWALVTVIVYAFILHLRLIPGLTGRVLFNSMALAGFSSVIMTYFGVNYYLSGLHSYAGGDPLPIPPVVFWSAAIVLVLSVGAAFNQYRIGKKIA